ncbi:MAG: 2'-5' RNA ligase family protein [Candidatus Altiarchaeota archaeon]
MAKYLIEIRFAGYAREYIRRLVYATARRFRIDDVTMKNAAPSLVILGPFRTGNEHEMLKRLVDVAGKYKMVSYRISGFNHYRGQRKWLVFSQLSDIIYLDIEPSDELRSLRRDLVYALNPICKGERLNELDWHKFHATVPFKDMNEKFDAVWGYLKDHEDSNLSQRLLRLTVVRGKRVLCEYDLTDKRLMLHGRYLSSHYIDRTIEFLKSKKPNIRLSVLSRKHRVKTIQTTLTQVAQTRQQESNMLPIFKGMRETFKQTTLSGEEAMQPQKRGGEIRPWIRRIIRPILSKRRGAGHRQTTLMREEGTWMRRMIIPLMSRQVDAKQE